MPSQALEMAMLKRQSFVTLPDALPTSPDQVIANNNVPGDNETRLTTKWSTAAGGGATSFVGLNDTPANYTGQAGKGVAVTAGEDGLEFVDEGTFIGLSDTPSSYSAPYYILQSDFLGTSLEWILNEFIGKADTPADYTGAAGLFCKVNVGENGLEFAAITEADISDLKNYLPLAGGVMGGNIDFATNFAQWPHGVIGPTTTFDGAFIGYSEDGTVQENEAIGLSVAVTGVGLWGPAVGVEYLRHANVEGQQVYVDGNGIFYGVDPPPPGWSVNTIDTGTYDLGVGAAPGAWTEIALDVNTGGDLANGDRLDVSYTLFIENRSPSRTGAVEIGFTIDGGVPTAVADTINISQNFIGYVSGAFSTAVTAAFPSGTNISLWARRGNGSHSSWNPVVRGAPVTEVHELFVSVPGSGGGGGGGGGFFQGDRGNQGSLATEGGDIFRTHKDTLSANTTIPANANSIAAGPLTIADGVTLTVEGVLVVV